MELEKVGVRLEESMELSYVPALAFNTGKERIHGEAARQQSFCNHPHTIFRQAPVHHPSLHHFEGHSYPRAWMRELSRHHEGIFGPGHCRMSILRSDVMWTGDRSFKGHRTRGLAPNFIQKTSRQADFSIVRNPEDVVEEDIVRRSNWQQLRQGTSLRLRS